MEKQPEDIRHDINRTREKLENTVEAIAYKADVTARAKDAVTDKIDSVKGAVGNALGIARDAVGGAAQTAQHQVGTLNDVAQSHLPDAVNGAHMVLDQARNTAANAGSQIRNLTDAAQSALPDQSQIRGAVNQAKTVAGSALDGVQGNPLGLALGALAVGLLVGSVLPATTIEREQIGGLGDQLTETAKAKASDVFEQGKTAVTQAVSQVVSAAGGSGDEDVTKDKPNTTNDAAGAKEDANAPFAQSAAA